MNHDPRYPALAVSVLENPDTAPVFTHRVVVHHAREGIDGFNAYNEFRRFRPYIRGRFEPWQHITHGCYTLTDEEGARAVAAVAENIARMFTPETVA